MTGIPHPVIRNQRATADPATPDVPHRVRLRNPPAGRSRSVEFARNWCAVSLVVLCFSGSIKSTPLLSWLPVDLTFLATLSILMAWLYFAHSNGRAFLPEMGPVIILWAFFVPGAYAALAGGLPSQKTILIYTTTLLCAVTPVIVGGSVSAIRTWILGTVLVGVTTGIATVAAPDTHSLSYLGRLDIEGGTTITTSRILGSVVVICVTAIILGAARGIATRMAGLAFAVSGLVLILLIGSRGPFTAVAITVPILVLTAKVRIARKLWGILIICIFAGAGYLYLNDQSDPISGSGRILQFLVGDSIDTIRQHLYTMSLHAAIDNPLGLGWGGFNSLPFAANFGYPHNLFLEVALEGGAIAALALVVFLCAAFRRLWRGSASPSGGILYALAIYWFCVAQFSSDFNGNRTTWAALGFAFCAVVKDMSTPDSPTVTGPVRSKAAAAGPADSGAAFGPHTPLSRTPSSAPIGHQSHLREA